LSLEGKRSEKMKEKLESEIEGTSAQDWGKFPDLGG